MRDSIELYGRSIADLPSKEDLVASVREMGARLEKLREATAIEHYNGPVLFEDRAAAEIFAQAFAPGLVTSRTPVSDDPRFELFFSQLIARMGGGDSLLNKIGGRVLPDFVDLVDNPRIEAYQGMKLMGAFDVDDDGVPSRETKLVEKGMLKAMLASRVPVQSISHSTGSRRGFGPAPSNLILSSQKTSSREELRQELLRRVKLRGLRYGVVVRRVGGNGANSLLRAAAMMGSAQAAPSNTLLEVYKIFPDGQEEPVRGMELEDVTSATFRDIVAVGDKPVVYNEQFMPKMASIFAMGMSGATTDLPVVSFVVPSLLFEEITLTKATGPFPNPPTSKAPLFDH
jgi:predicted Zn-dependent protease